VYVCVCVYVLLSLIVSGFFCRLRYSLWKRTDWDKWYYTKKLISRKMSNNSNSDRSVVICLFVCYSRSSIWHLSSSLWSLNRLLFHFFLLLFSFFYPCVSIARLHSRACLPKFFKSFIFFCSLSSSPFFFLPLCQVSNNKKHDLTCDYSRRKNLFKCLSTYLWKRKSFTTMSSY
jgi:hypothetical protein